MRSGATSTCCETLDKKLEFIINEATRRFEIKLRFLDRSRFREEVQTFLHIYNASLEGTWGFTPLSQGEIEHMSAAMRHLVVPELTTVAEVDGRPVAAAFGLLDYNPRIKLINGRLFPFGFVRLLTRRTKDHAGSADQHERLARIPALGSGSRGPGPTGSGCAEVGDPGGGVLLGPGEQSSVLQVAQARGGQIDQDLPDLRLSSSAGVIVPRQKAYCVRCGRLRRAPAGSSQLESCGRLPAGLLSPSCQGRSS